MEQCCANAIRALGAGAEHYARKKGAKRTYQLQLPWCCQPLQQLSNACAYAFARANTLADA